MRTTRETTVPTFAGLCLGLGLSLLVAGPAAAQPGDSSGANRVAVIDVQRLVLESAKGQAALERLRKLAEQKQGEADAIEQQVKDLQAQVQVGRGSLANDRLAALEKELEDKIIEYERFEDDAEREMKEEQAEAFGEIESEIMPIITRAGTELQYTLVFNKFSSGLLYAGEDVDITDLILERYNTVAAGDD
jgi:Skp family chaperone for outer membrane proteins